MIIRHAHAHPSELGLNFLRGIGQAEQMLCLRCGDAHYVGTGHQCPSCAHHALDNMPFLKGTQRSVDIRLRKYRAPVIVLHPAKQI